MVLKHEASAVVVVALVINLAIAGAVVVVAVVVVAVVLLVAMFAPLMQSFFSVPIPMSILFALT